jgi:hypothetical protein
LCCFFAAAPQAHASNLTEPQIQSVLNLLAAFNVDSTTVANVNSILHGSTPEADKGCTSCAPSVAPHIDSTSAKAAGNLEVDAGGQVMINGENLATVDSTRVYIGGINSAVVWTSNTEVTANVPTSLTPGRTYSLYIVNRYGTSNTVWVKVSGPVQSASAPTCYITSDKVGVNYGDTYTINWSSSNANYMTGLHTQDKWPTSGSQTLSTLGYPAGLHTDTLTFVGYGGSMSCSSNISVVVSQPTASFDSSSLTTTSQHPLITGSASGVNSVSLVLRGYGGGSANVVNGRWAININDTLPPGTYFLQLNDDDNSTVLAQANLTILASGDKSSMAPSANANVAMAPACPPGAALQTAEGSCSTSSMTASVAQVPDIAGLLASAAMAPWQAAVASLTNILYAAGAY